MTEAFFATGYVRLLYRLLRAEGLSEGVLFSGTGLSETDLMRAAFEMPFESEMRLVSNALDHAEPGLGLRVGHQLQLAAHGTLGTAMQSAPSLQIALETFIKLISVRASFFSISLTRGGSSASISVSVNNLTAKLVPFFTEAILHTVTNCIVFYTGRQDSVKSIEVPYAEPEYGSLYRSVFGSEIAFSSSSTTLNFPVEQLSLRSPEEDAEVFSESVRRCQLYIHKRDSSQDLVLAIDKFLVENPGKLWTAAEIAPLFAVSERTLLRKLKERGSTFQLLRDNSLKQLAKTCLPAMSVEATAATLGFADTASFRRTFKRWFGKTPSQFRIEISAS